MSPPARWYLAFWLIAMGVFFVLGGGIFWQLRRLTNLLERQPPGRCNCGRE